MKVWRSHRAFLIVANWPLLVLMTRNANFASSSETDSQRSAEARARAMARRVDELLQACVAILAECKSDKDRNRALSDVLWALPCSIPDGVLKETVRRSYQIAGTNSRSRR